MIHWQQSFEPTLQNMITAVILTNHTHHYKLGYIDALKQVLGPASSPLKKAQSLRDFENMNSRENNRQ
jgi:hypothetical protein